MRRSILAAGLILAWTGPGGANGGAGDDGCGAAALQALVGRPVAEVRGELPDEARIIPPGSAVTQDHRPERLNVDLDEGDVIVRLWCG